MRDDISRLKIDVSVSRSAAGVVTFVAFVSFVTFVTFVSFVAFVTFVTFVVVALVLDNSNTKVNSCKYKLAVWREFCDILAALTSDVDGYRVADVLCRMKRSPTTEVEYRRR